MRINHAFKILLLLIALSFFSVTALAKLPSETPLQKVPAALIDTGSKEESYAFVVEKATQRLFLYEIKNGQYFLKSSFSISTGEKNGDKKKEGDVRTPEGFYIFNNKFIKKELADIYGILAYPMDYPNFWDRRLGKNGKGIWMHGTNRKLKPWDSNGCVALNNIDILTLEGFIRLYETPIIIYDRIVYSDIRDNKKKAGEIKAFIESWSKAWEQKDFRRYRLCYAQNFSSNAGMNYRAWMTHKERLNKKYKKIKIDIRHLRLFEHQGMIVALFKQYYRGGSFISNGDKRLYLRKQGSGFKIVAEVWSPFPPRERVKKLPFAVRNEVLQKARVAELSPPALPKKDVRLKAGLEKEKIRFFLENWLANWRDKNVNGYINHYHPDFRYRNMNLAGFRDYKSRVFKKYNKMFIGVRKLKVKIEKSRAHVTFIQDFRTKQYQDRGLKKLLLVKHGNSWRIKEESWDQIKAGAKP
ncbi:MAG: L,D-transpeptidase family protein [Deltaproteobacteria bacterium]|nr:L,D-transpeptidase family protein [Deltaproteobacteria bacterium]MBW2051612.1 L,D-transpeptidase family protein [Deltaproteobacteria bacterium]MBW2140746.1 L,D-transpeptidase family protein [Deltaproteobacteria bacterium]MBW2322697.1 L,D-transpeptidase family protein [Deltaproteobacteria bacterium]